MSLAVLPALIPDIPRVYDIYFAAFSSEAMGSLMLSVLFPAGHSSPEFRAAHAAATAQYWHKSAVQYTYKLVDTAAGDIVGMALADIYVRPRSEEERKFEGVSWLSGRERERAEAVVRPLWEMREKLFGGRPYIYSHVFAVEPSYQGRKGGAAMLQFGISIAESTNLPVYFEASPTTVALYEKFGFERLDETIVHKAESLGIEADITVPLVVRMPSRAAMTFKQWRERGYPAWQ